MALDRLPETTATVYAELLEQALAVERTAPESATVPGGVVAKKLGAHSYLYWQIRKGDRSAQRYLGADTPELRAALARLRQDRANLELDRTALARLAAMALRGGMLREETPVVSVLDLLAGLGLFRRGGVLVGTLAYRTYGNLLGVALAATTLRTQDIDVAHDLAIALATLEEGPPGVVAGLTALGLLPVPGLGRGEPSTSFKIRGRDLRVDFLVPAGSRRRDRAVSIPALGISAQPLPMLDYLIEEPIPAVVLGAVAVLVRVPRPARFALHKLWTAAQRSPSESAKSRRDRAQAAAVLELLRADRPGDLDEAWEALDARPTARRIVEREFHRTLDSE